jgi:integrase
MAAIQKLPSGNWRVQVRRRGITRTATFAKKREAQDWAAKIEVTAQSIAVSGFAKPPADSTVGDLIDRYVELAVKDHGKTKEATLTMLGRELGSVKLADLSSLVLRDFIDKRVKQGAGGVTIAADLSYLSAVLKWGRHARNLDLPERLALDARASLKHRGLDTRSKERTREPTDEELAALYAHWDANERMRIPMPIICKFALASGMRLGEILRITAEDVDSEARTVLIRDRKDPQRKVGNDQVVPLLPEAWAIVQSRIKASPEGRIFPFDASSASTAFTKACQALGIEDLHFHDLRHRATAQFFREGLSIPQVALITGHRSWAMLRRYTDVRAGDVHAALAQAQALKKKAGRRTGAAK